MADVEDVGNYIEEIEFLRTMFGETVSTAVIETVIESCNGNVHLAADAIMNFADEMSIHPSEENTESVDVKPVQITSVLNVDAQPFEYRAPLPTEHQPSLPDNLQSLTPQVPTTERQEPTTTTNQPDLKSVNSLSLTNVRQKSPTALIEYPLTASQQHMALNHEPQALDWQQPSTSWLPSSPLQQQNPSASEARPFSFFEAFRNSGALPKKPPDSNPPKPLYTMKNTWRDVVDKILHYHNQGARILIIMRGVSGSGKTHLAKHIVDYAIGPSSQNYSRHIFSTDNYFMRNGVYKFTKDSLADAHAMNQRKVCEATNKGVSPVIVDNTNTELWEMEPYIRDGVRNGYMIEFVEPRTPWARNLNQLERRNIHGVSRDGIRRMLDRFDRGITPESAMKSLRLSYFPNRKPPVLRNIPPYIPPGSPGLPKSAMTSKVEDQPSNAVRAEIASQENPESSVERWNPQLDNSETNNTPDSVDETSNDEHEIKVKKIIEAQKKLEQFEKVVQEWENGESWDAATEENNNVSQDTIGGFGSEGPNPKPPRKNENEETDKIIKSIDMMICDDWAKFMPSWQDSSITNSSITVATPVLVETKNVGTGFEVDDMNEHLHTVMYGNPRDINEGIQEKTTTKIPKAIVFDKSTSTHDNDFLTKKEVCKNKEHHFRELRRMFRSVPSQALRDIFESCDFDVNWVVNLVLDSYPESQEIFNSGVAISDEDDEGPLEECNCLAGYNIVPDMAPIVNVVAAPDPENALQPLMPAQKKTKRELSDNSLQLKRQIESNVTISDKHYSQHHLNLRRRRENNFEGSDRSTVSVSINELKEGGARTNIAEVETGENATALPESTTGFKDIAGPSTANYNLQFLDADPIDSDTESDSNKSDTPETTITINLGREFLQKLDELFGRKDFLYPDNIKPVVNLPLSILQQINAHWAMSVAAQMDDLSRQSEAMIKQDEEFARELAAREQEMSEEGKEPEVPTLKEIMDMEVAYAIYERGIAEWRNNEPQDLAAKLSREKLYNLFPDLTKEVLSEMLMAHDYSFKATIESLIISTGQSSWLEDEKGVEKFVMHKEMERKEKFLEEQNKNLDETEWPHLTNPDKPITLETVKFYRAEAEKSLQCRNTNFEKARQYFARNNPSAASFYSDIAALHTRKYEQSSSLAAAYLMNFHLLNNPDHDVLDLHYLRVPEAMVNLDIFLDQVILRLRAKNVRCKETWIITGKGLHSVGGPRIKPATRRRLKAREITIKHVNGGMLMAELHPTDKMTNELAENKS